MDRQGTKASITLEQSFAATTRQMKQVSDGIAAARDGKVAPAEEFFAGTAEKQG